MKIHVLSYTFDVEGKKTGKCKIGIHDFSYSGVPPFQIAYCKHCGHVDMSNFGAS